MALSTLIEQLTDGLVIIHKSRYGGGYLATPTEASLSNAVYATYEETSGCNSLWGVENEWWPVGSAATEAKALEDLNVKLTHLKNEIPYIAFGIKKIAELGDKLNIFMPCEIVSLDSLKDAYREWDESGEEPIFF